MQEKTFGILMKLLAFGILFLTTDFAKKGLSVKVGKKQNRE